MSVTALNQQTQARHNPTADARPLRTAAPRQPRPLRRRVECSSAAGKDSSKAAGQQPAAAAAPASPARPNGRLARLLSFRSSARPALAEEAKTVQAPSSAVPEHLEQQVAAAGRAGQKPALPAAAASATASRPSPDELQQAQQQVQDAVSATPGRFSLYSWLTWGSGSASTSSASSSTDCTDIAELADGMAAVPQPNGGGGAARTSSSRRSWYSLSRSSMSSSLDEADSAAALAAQQAQQAAQPVRVDHPSLQLLRQRALSGSQPGARRDPFKLGLVVEGGGMRGCVSGGALQALADLGLRDCFDAVYGSSAGAINSTYFLSGQRTGVDIYHDHIACPEFIDLKRLWKGEGVAPVLNLPFLIDHVMHSVHPLDWQAVLASPIPLKVVASSLDTLHPVILHSFQDRSDLATCLKASATVPEIAGGPCLHRNQRLVDAAVFEPVPFRSAIADGCTHLLVLCTRPRRRRRSRLNSAVADAVEVAIKKAVLSPDYMVPAWKAEVEYLMADGISQDDMLLKAATQEEAHQLPWFAGSHVYPLYPGAAANFSPLCTDVPTLKAGVAEGRRAVLAVCRAVLGDALSFNRFEELSTSNIVPTRGANGSSERLWRRYMREDFSHHA